MIHDRGKRNWAAVTGLAVSLALGACGAANESSANAKQASRAAFEPITIQHKLGTTVVNRRPQRVAALEMNEVDFLDQLGVPVAGMPKDFVPHFLAKYKNNPDIADLGSIVQPNVERVHALKPDIILITSLQANRYNELAGIAPTVNFDVDFRNSQNNHIGIVKDHLLTLGRIFGKEDRARRKVAELDGKIEEVRRVAQNRPEKALIVLHNNGAFSSMGIQSRYGFVFDALGVKPATTAVETGLHGQPISNEFIQQVDPDILYVIDRTAVMERRPALDANSLGNPLLRQTKAWKNGRVVFVDPDAWYTTGASVTSLKIVMDDVLKGYRD